MEKKIALLLRPCTYIYQSQSIKVMGKSLGTVVHGKWENGITAQSAQLHADPSDCLIDGTVL